MRTSIDVEFNHKEGSLHFNNGIESIDRVLSFHNTSEETLFLF